LGRKCVFLPFLIPVWIVLLSHNCFFFPINFQWGGFL
jgi:hypothetical protein